MSVSKRFYLLPSLLLLVSCALLSGFSCGDKSGAAPGGDVTESQNRPDSSDIRVGNEREDAGSDDGNGDSSEGGGASGGGDGTGGGTGGGGGESGGGGGGGGEPPPGGVGLLNLTKGRLANSYNPAWLPDGSGLVFTAETSSGSLGLYKIDIGGADITALTNDPDHDYVNLPGAAICTLDDRLVISTDRGGHDDIWILHLNSGLLVQVTNDIYPDWEPTWSPDCQRIVFQSKRDGNWDIYKINADGTGLTRLTTDPAKDWEPNWSPIGGRIVFQSYRDNNWRLYLIGEDGGGLTALAGIDGEATDPSWSPDGGKVIFSGDADSSSSEDILTIDVNTGETANLTNYAGYEGAPSISGDGRFIAFEADWEGSMNIYIKDY